MIESQRCAASAFIVMAKPTGKNSISLNGFVSEVSSDIR